MGDIHLDIDDDAVYEINGCRIAGVVLNGLTAALPLGQCFKIQSREDGVVTVYRCPPILISIDVLAGD